MFRLLLPSCLLENIFSTDINAPVELTTVKKDSPVFPGEDEFFELNPKGKYAKVCNVYQGTPNQLNCNHDTAWIEFRANARAWAAQYTKSIFKKFYNLKFSY